MMSLIKKGHVICKDLDLIEICYSIKQKGLKNVFDEAIVAALTPPVEKRNKKCRVL